MKKYRNDSSSNVLLEALNYGDTRSLKNTIKHLLLLNEHSTMDSSQICIITDLKKALGLYKDSNNVKVLSEKQRDVLIRHLIHDETQQEIARYYGISQQGVSVILNSGLNRIKKYLTEGYVNKTPWTEEEKQYLLENYNILKLDVLAERLNKDKRKVTSMYHYLKNKGM